MGVSGQREDHDEAGAGTLVTSVYGVCCLPAVSWEPFNSSLSVAGDTQQLGPSIHCPQHKGQPS